MPTKNFIKSLASSKAMAMTGGKTNSSFIQTHDQFFIFKEIGKLEFQMFLDSAKSYFSHILNQLNFTTKTTKSILSKIYGVFQLKMNKQTFYYIAMENVYLGVDQTSPTLKIYDLKGSKTNRLV